MKMRVIALTDIRMERTIYRDGSVPTERWEDIAIKEALLKVASERNSLGPQLDLSYKGSQWAGNYNREFYFTLVDEEPSWSEHQTGWAYSGPRTLHSNAPFKEKCKAGDIVVSPFHASTGFGTYTIGEKTKPGSVYVNLPVHELYDVNAFPKGRYDRSVIINGRDYMGQFKSIYSYIEISDGDHPLNLGFDPDKMIQDLKDRFTVESVVNDPMVLGVLSEANSGTLDLLTSIAEMPETIRSLLGLMQTIVKIGHDAKRKQFNLTAQNERLKAKLAQRRLSLDSEIADLTEKLRSSPPNKHNKRQLRELDKLRRKRRNLIKKNRSLGRELYQLGEELATAIADLWMQYRYEIKTTQFMIEDIIDSFEQMGREFVRWRDRKILEIKIPDHGDFVFKGDATLTHRCFIKRSFKAEDTIGQLNQILRANFTVTFWELLKKSFVVDWFFTIGDAISALFHNDNYHLQEGSCYSWKLELDGEFHHVDDAKCAVGIKYSEYQRIVLNPRSSIGLYFVPDWSPVRQLDTAAMLWPSVKKSVQSLIRELDKLNRKGK